MTAKTMRLPGWKKILFLAIPFVLAFIALEIIVRLAGLQPAASFDTPPQAYFFVSDARLGWRNRANGRYRYAMIDGAPVSTTDSLGYRNGYGWTPRGETPIILFIGDSAAFSAEVNDDATLPSEVARHIKQKINSRVLNAGVRGYNTVQSLRWMERTLDRFPDVAMVIYVSSPNDLVENLNPITRYPLRAPTLQWDAARRRLTQREVDTLASPAGEAFAPDAPNALVRSTRWLREHSALAQHVGLRLRRLFDTPAVLRKKITLDNGAIGPIDDGMPVWDEQRAWALDNGGLDAMRRVLEQGHETCRRRGIHFAVTAFTRGEPATWYDDVQALADHAGLSFIDVRPAFTDDPLSYAAKRRDGLYDPHYGPKGTRTFAEAATPFIEATLTPNHPPPPP